MKYTGTSLSASCCIKHEDFSCYMCFISRPLIDRVIKVIQHRKGLYGFYYTLVTLTKEYEILLYHDDPLSNCALRLRIRNELYIHVYDFYYAFVTLTT